MLNWINDLLNPSNDTLVKRKLKEATIDLLLSLESQENHDLACVYEAAHADMLRKRIARLTVPTSATPGVMISGTHFKSPRDV